MFLVLSVHTAELEVRREDDKCNPLDWPKIVAGFFVTRESLADLAISVIREVRKKQCASSKPLLSKVPDGAVHERCSDHTPAFTLVIVRLQLCIFLK